jgi:hypothetical protein
MAAHAGMCHVAQRPLFWRGGLAETPGPAVDIWRAVADGLRERAVAAVRGGAYRVSQRHSALM